MSLAVLSVSDSLSVIRNPVLESTTIHIMRDQDGPYSSPNPMLAPFGIVSVPRFWGGSLPPSRNLQFPTYPWRLTPSAYADLCGRFPATPSSSTSGVRSEAEPTPLNDLYEREESFLTKAHFPDLETFMRKNADCFPLRGKALRSFGCRRTRFDSVKVSRIRHKPLRSLFRFANPFAVDPDCATPMAIFSSSSRLLR
jgi:hypothetical protein